MNTRRPHSHAAARWLHRRSALPPHFRFQLSAFRFLLSFSFPRRLSSVLRLPSSVLGHLSAFILALGPVTAALPVEPDFTAMSLEDLGGIKVDTVYGASKHEQKVTEAPSAVSIVTADEIKKQGYRTLADVLRNVRGFYVTYDRGSTTLGVRGINIPGDFGGRLLITVDGHSLNEPIYSMNASDMNFILDVDLIERVEVIRGPGSSLYGNNAFLGVVNVISRKGGDVNGAEISSSAATFDTYTGRVSYGNKFTNGVELLVSGTLYDTAGQPELYYPEFSTINNGVAENMDDRRAGSAFASISWQGLSLEGGYVKNRKTWPTAPYSTDDALVIFNNPAFVESDTRAFARLQFQHAFENEWELLASATYDYYGLVGVYPYYYFDPLQPLTLNEDIVQAQSVGGLLQASRTFFEKHRITAGTELRYDLQLDQKNADREPPEIYLDSKESAHILSLFAQDEFQMFKNLILNAGLRYDHFSTFGGTLNPRIALIYQPWEPSTFKLIYGQAFRAPNSYENYYESMSQKLNPDLGPETIRSYELVYEQQFSKHWQGNVSLFFNDIQNPIILQKDPADGLSSFNNLDPVRTRGAEFEIASQWAGGLRQRASYTYTHTEDTVTGLQLSNSPEHLGQFSLSIPFWQDKLFASTELQVMSGRNTIQGNTVSSYWLINATLFSQKIVKGLDASVSVYNLFNHHYFDPASSDFKQDSIQQDGRMLRLKLNYRF